MPDVYTVFRNPDRKREKAERVIEKRETVGFHVEIISPAADRLGKDKAGRDDIAQEEGRKLPVTGENDQDDQAGKDASIDRKAAFPNPEDCKGI